MRFLKAVTTFTGWVGSNVGSDVEVSVVGGCRSVMLAFFRRDSWSRFQPSAASRGRRGAGIACQARTPRVSPVDHHAHNWRNLSRFVTELF
jgi:hypothetical protein